MAATPLSQIKNPRGCWLKQNIALRATVLSGIVSCDAAAIRIRIRIVRCQRLAKRQKHKPCETQAHFLPPRLLVGSKELVLKVPKRRQLCGPNRAMQPRCAMRFESHIPKSLAMRKSFFFFYFNFSLAMRKHIRLIWNHRKMPEQMPAKILRCWPAMRKIGVFFKDRAMRNPCDSDSRCGLACDASTRDAKSLSMWVERCEPLRTAISRCDSCDNLTLRFVCPKSTWERDSIAAKLLRCGIASEALRRNMPLSDHTKTTALSTENAGKKQGEEHN